MLISSSPSLDAVRHSGPDSIVNKSEEVPLGRSFGLKVPEDPTLGVLLESADLSLNVIRGGGFEVLIPLIDEVLVCARANVCGGFAWLRVCAVISSTNTIAILRKRLVCIDL